MSFLTHTNTEGVQPAWGGMWHSLTDVVPAPGPRIHPSHLHPPGDPPLIMQDADDPTCPGISLPGLSTSSCCAVRSVSYTSVLCLQIEVIRSKAAESRPNINHILHALRPGFRQEAGNQPVQDTAGLKGATMTNDGKRHIRNEQCKSCLSEY